MGDYIFVWTFTEVMRAIFFGVAILAVIGCVVWALLDHYVLRRFRKPKDDTGARIRARYRGK